MKLAPLAVLKTDSVELYSIVRDSERDNCRSLMRPLNSKSDAIKTVVSLKYQKVTFTRSFRKLPSVLLVLRIRNPATILNVFLPLTPKDFVRKNFIAFCDRSAVVSQSLPFRDTRCGLYLHRMHMIVHRCMK